MLLSTKVPQHARANTCANINSRSAEGARPFAGRGRQGILSRSEPQGHQQAQAVAMTTALGGSPELRRIQWVGRNSDGCRRSEFAPAATLTRCQHFLRQQRSELHIPDCFQSAEAQGHRNKGPVTSEHRLLDNVDASFACSSIGSCDAGGFQLKGDPIVDEWTNECGYLAICNQCQPGQGCGTLKYSLRIQKNSFWD